MSSCRSPVFDPAGLRVGSLRHHADAQDLAHLTYPALRPRLSAGTGEGLLARVAYRGGGPVGLALGIVDPAGEAYLQSVAVEPAFRGRGIGRRLAAALQAAASAEGARALVVRAGRMNASLPALDRMLQAIGLPAMTCHSARVTGFAEGMATVGGRWDAVGRVLASTRITFDPLAALSADRQDGFTRFVIRSDAVRGRALAQGEFELRASIAVHRDGVPVGWVLGRRVDGIHPEASGAPCVFYDSANIEARHLRHGALVGAFWHAFTAQARAFGPHSIATYLAGTERMIELSRRRFAPIALRFEEVMETRIALEPPRRDAA